MRGFVAALIAMVVAGSVQAAVAEPITLQPSALHERPGIVAVDTQDVTTVTFCQPISWSAFKAPWLHATVSAQDKRVLLLDASASGGEAVLMVWAQGDGAPLQLLVKASAQQLWNHLYNVACPAGAAAVVTPAVTEPRQPARPVPSTPAPAASAPRPQPAQSAVQVKPADWDAFTKGLSKQQWALLTTAIANPTSPTMSAFEATLTPQQQAQWAPIKASMTPTSSAPTSGAPSQAAASTPAPLPAWLAWQVHATSSGTGTLVSYSLQNTGQTTVVLDLARLKVTAADGNPVTDVSLTRQDTSGLEGRIPAGGAESGVIRISGTTHAQIWWPVVALDSQGKTYLISQPVE